MCELESEIDLVTVSVCMYVCVREKESSDRLRVFSFFASQTLHNPKFPTTKNLRAFLLLHFFLM